MSVKGYLAGAFSIAAIMAGVYTADVIHNHLASEQQPTPVAQTSTLSPSEQQVAPQEPPITAAEQAIADATTAKLNRMVDIMFRFAQDHVDGGKANNLDGMITAMLQGLAAHMDPHSEYMSPDETAAMMKRSSGVFAGIGARLGIDETTKFAKIFRVIEATPAERAGIKVGDLITHINGIRTDTMDIEHNIEKIRGEVGTPITLTILHEGAQEETDMTLIREKVTNQPVQYSRIGNIGHISLETFMYMKTGEDGNVLVGPDGEPLETGATLVHDSILKALAEIGPDIQGLIFDLRYNGGGDQNQAAKIAGDFLGPDKVVMIKQGRIEEANEVVTTGSAKQITNGIPTIFLVNGQSGSASELLAGAVQDQDPDHITIMGRQTFGKGSFQSFLPLNGGDAVKITIGLYHTPDGHTVQGVGITPDIWYTGKTPLDSIEVPRESEMKNVLPDQADKTPHQTSKICGPVSEDMSPEAVAKYFNSRAVLGADGKVDGMILCAVEDLQGQSKWTITQPYTMPADAPAALTH